MELTNQPGSVDKTKTVMSIALERAKQAKPKVAPKAPPTAAPTFITETSAAAGNMRGEAILGVPHKGIIWTDRIEVTPAQAKLILINMRRQRSLRPTHVKAMAEAMKAGTWLSTHQGLAFDVEGSLIDGQHRLNAQIESGVTLTHQVTFGLPVSAFAVMDRHQRRNTADDLVTSAMVEPKFAKVVAGAMRFVNNYDRGLLPWVNGPDSRVNAAMAAAILERHPVLVRAADYAYSKSHRRIMPLTILAAFGCLFIEANRKLAYDFLDQLTVGDGLRVGDPAWTLRDMLLRSNDLRSKDQQSIMVGMARAWNAFVEGRRLQKIDTTARGEGFPRIQS
jgi:hypothetical protein